jgi:hypothetical protein
VTRDHDDNPDSDAGTHDADLVEIAEAWQLEQPEPTTLIALWPAAQSPTMTEVLAAIDHQCDGRAEMSDQLDTEDERVQWNMVVRVPELPAPLIVWSEPSRPIPPEEFESDELRRQAGEARWVIGVETMLHPSDPLTDYVALMRLISGAFSDVPAILDVNTQQWHARERLVERYGPSDAEPPSMVMWVIHQVGPEVESASVDNGQRIWMHTHGLWRCGRPELEMLDVPLEHAPAASLLINAMAEMMLEMALPPPGQPFEVGAGLRVAVQPWSTLVSSMDESVSGSMKDRGGELAMMHTGVRAVICAERPLDGPNGESSWTWPREILGRLERDEATLYGTTRATERQSRLARATWPELAMGFASLPQGRLAGDDPPALFVIKAGFSSPEKPEAGREHLWFRAMRFSGDRAEGQLLNRPLIMTHMDQGSCVWLDRASVSDWSVLTEAGQFGPSDTAAMQRAIDAIVAANSQERS